MPDSPLIQRIRNSKEIIRSSPAGAGGAIGGGSPRPGAAMAERPSPNAGRGQGETTPREQLPRERAGKKRGTVQRNDMPAGVTGGGSGAGVGPPVRKEVVVRSSAYPGEIVASGEFSGGGTVVLRKGKSVNAP
jgi:hypothetical protein